MVAGIKQTGGAGSAGDADAAGSARAWALLPALLLGAQAAALILLGNDAGNWANDQTNYHVVAIEQFARQFPTPDIVNYPSATSPGWHLLLALLVKAGAGLTALRWVSALAGVCLMLVATLTAARWVAPRTAAFLMLPLALSPYAVGGSAWVTTDVPALACIAAALAAAMATTPGRQWPLWLSALIAAVGVAIRQPVAWLAAPIAWTAIRERRWWGALAALWPLGVLAVLVALWGGMMPPKYRYLHDHGANPAGVAVLLALAACWASPLAAAVAWKHFSRRGALIALACAAAALLFVLAIPTSLSVPEGRCYGPIWQLVQRVPAPGDRSLVMVVLAPLGAASIAVLAHAALLRGMKAHMGVALISLACVAAANAANSQAWERYADLPLLLLLPWLAALAIRTTSMGRAVGAAALLVGAMQVGVAAVNLWVPAFRGAAP